MESDDVMLDEVMRYLLLLNSEQSLLLLPPAMLATLQSAVISAGRLVERVYGQKEVELAISDQRKH